MPCELIASKSVRERNREVYVDHCIIVISVLQYVMSRPTIFNDMKRPVLRDPASNIASG